MSITYIGARIGMFILVVWLATTVIFFLPRIASDRNPVRERLVMMAATGNLATGMEKVVEAYEKEYGLDQPLYLQYIRYLSSPRTRRPELLSHQLPDKGVGHDRTADAVHLGAGWNLGLNRGCAWFAVRRNFGLARCTKVAKGGLAGLPDLVTDSLFHVGDHADVSLCGPGISGNLNGGRCSPLAGATSVTTVYDGWNMDRILDTIYHSILPAMSIILSQIGFWALGMRGMMVTTQGEDYGTLAQMRGLKPSRVFSLYGMRNATLPQLSSLALAMSLIFSGVILVEVIYRYPGMGTLLYNAIAGFDYFVIYGVVFVLIVMVAASTFILDIAYPFIDPRVRRAA